jgi:hypothetical protein
MRASDTAHSRSFNIHITTQTTVESKISISLDAWTSSNNFAFMAVVAHYITNAGKLGKLQRAWI